MSADNHDYCPQCKLTTDTRLEPTLAEFYVIGMTTKGKFYVQYRCKCSKCGFAFDYDIEIDAMRIENDRNME